MSNASTASAIYNILAFTFQGQKTAGETVKQIKGSGALDGYDIVAQCVVEQDAKGKVHIHEPGHGGIGGTIGAVAGGLLGVIGGPAGVLALGAAGAAIGGAAGHYWGRVVPKEDLEELGEALTPDSSAMLLLLEDTYSEDVVNSMAGYSAKVVTLTVGNELSGEIAQYTAAAASDADGNVVAGESVVAADADGNVVAGVAVAAADADGDVAAASEEVAASADVIADDTVADDSSADTKS